ncbi:hypothetical protein ASE63_22215 [Bosea sp. Root381]|uniref:tyrosine-type recombinase/integrase n=1 Tax=Bosea sp. Root381 TaxID=1736524 RepID=UPI000701AD7E|nr:tyrosine-type recombinase/integrase [Bosea sp. Root381]KRE07417.1 hypothetical protein ASE63_22215 [Bosea sp. Root381]
MSVYKPPGAVNYVYDFEFNGTRFRKSARTASKREAEVVERKARERAKRDAERQALTQAAFKGEGPLTLGVATARWWQEKGQHNTNSETDFHNLARMVAWFGEDRRLDDITDPDITAWVAARRGERIKGRETLKDKSPAPLVKPATVNRSTVEALRKLFTYARKKWKIRYSSEPEWREHRVPEPGEQVAELTFVDQERVRAHLTEGYREAAMFALASGLRLNNCLLKWSEIDWEGGRLKVTQKGNRTHTMPLSRDMRAILSTCIGHDETWVFTFPLRRRSKQRRVLGERFPVTYYGLQIAWRRAAEELGIDLTFHGLRHTTGTRILRQTGNIKAAQKVLGHASAATTSAYYAHATEDDVRNALDATPLNSPRIEAPQPKKRRRSKEIE